jgi:hypothetical protein
MSKTDTISLLGSTCELYPKLGTSAGPLQFRGPNLFPLFTVSISSRCGYADERGQVSGIIRDQVHHFREESQQSLYYRLTTFYSTRPFVPSTTSVVTSPIVAGTIPNKGEVPHVYNFPNFPSFLEHEQQSIHPYFHQRTHYHYYTLMQSSNINSKLNVFPMFLKTWVFLALAAAAAPIARTPNPNVFTAVSTHSGNSDVHLQGINASGQKFYLKRPTGAYCSSVQGLACSKSTSLPIAPAYCPPSC